MMTRIATITLNPAIDQTAAVPNFRPDAVNRVLWEQADAGGKGVNVASFLADAGHAVSVTGFLGAENPTLFETLFHRKAIADHFVRIPGKTRVNVKLVDEAQGQVTDINFPGQSVTEADQSALMGAIATLTPTHDWFVLAGSIPAGVSPTLYHDLVVSLKAQGKTLVLDTSGAPLGHALTAQPDVIKPNVVELGELLGMPLADEVAVVAAARDLVRSGIRLVVVSMGADGALFVNADTAIHAQPPTVEVKSTVGAGDAMVAGTVAGLVAGKSLADCAQLATAFSIGALGQLGPRLPPMEVIAAMCDRVSLRYLD